MDDSNKNKQKSLLKVTSDKTTGKKKLVVNLKSVKTKKEDDFKKPTIRKEEKKPLVSALPAPQNKFIGTNNDIFTVKDGTKSEKNIFEESSVIAPYPSISTEEPPQYLTGYENDSYYDYTSSASDQYTSLVDPYENIPEHERKKLKTSTVKQINQTDLVHRTEAEQAKALGLAMQEDTTVKGSFDFSENQYKKHNVQWLAHRALQNQHLIEQKAATDRLKRAQTKRKYGF